mmetsp:Transcript_20454/g.44626  ORF Transcript_20454/g.44626 Transcript_20454/m.44626 type:complete len:352 (+) Transcript_20454:2133-3188(+)
MIPRVHCVHHGALDERMRLGVHEAAIAWLSFLVGHLLSHELASLLPLGHHVEHKRQFVRGCCIKSRGAPNVSHLRGKPPGADGFQDLVWGHLTTAVLLKRFVRLIQLLLLLRRDLAPLMGLDAEHALQQGHSRLAIQGAVTSSNDFLQTSAEDTVKLGSRNGHSHARRLKGGLTHPGNGENRRLSLLILRAHHALRAFHLSECLHCHVVHRGGLRTSHVPCLSTALLNKEAVQLLRHAHSCLLALAEHLRSRRELRADWVKRTGKASILETELELIDGLATPSEGTEDSARKLLLRIGAEHHSQSLLHLSRHLAAQSGAPNDEAIAARERRSHIRHGAMLQVDLIYTDACR